MLYIFISTGAFARDLPSPQRDKYVYNLEVAAESTYLTSGTCIISHNLSAKSAAQAYDQASWALDRLLTRWETLRPDLAMHLLRQAEPRKTLPAQLDEEFAKARQSVTELQRSGDPQAALALEHVVEKLEDFNTGILPLSTKTISEALTSFYRLRQRFEVELSQMNFREIVPERRLSYIDAEHALQLSEADFLQKVAEAIPYVSGNDSIPDILFLIGGRNPDPRLEHAAKVALRYVRSGAEKLDPQWAMNEYENLLMMDFHPLARSAMNDVARKGLAGWNPVQQVGRMSAFADRIAIMSDNAFADGQYFISEDGRWVLLRAPRAQTLLFGRGVLIKGTDSVDAPLSEGLWPGHRIINNIQLVVPPDETLRNSSAPGENPAIDISHSTHP